MDFRLPGDSGTISATLPWAHCPTEIQRRHRRSCSCPPPPSFAIGPAHPAADRDETAPTAAGILPRWATRETHLRERIAGCGTSDTGTKTACCRGQSPQGRSKAGQGEVPTPTASGDVLAHCSTPLEAGLFRNLPAPRRKETTKLTTSTQTLSKTRFSGQSGVWYPLLRWLTLGRGPDSLLSAVLPWTRHQGNRKLCRRQGAGEVFHKNLRCADLTQGFLLGLFSEQHQPEANTTNPFTIRNHSERSCPCPSPCPPCPIHPKPLNRM